MNKKNNIYIFYFIVFFFSLFQTLSSTTHNNSFKYLNVKTYGAKGNGRADDTDAFLRLARATNDVDSVFIFIPKGKYLINQQIVFNCKKIFFSGDGSSNTILDFSKSNIPSGESCLLFTGEIKQITSPIKRLSKNETLIHFPKKTELSPSDFFTIKDNNAYSYSYYRAYYKSGELSQVKSLNQNSITLSNPLFADYRLTNQLILSKVSPIICKIENFSLKLKKTTDLGHTGIMVNSGYLSEINNIDASGTNFSHITLNLCFKTKVYDINIDYSSKSIGLNYGLTIANSQDIEVFNCKLKAENHGIAIGGNDYPYSIVNRNILVRDSELDAYSGYGADMHGNVEYVTYHKCLMKSGVTIGGNNTEISNCEIYTDKDGIGLFFGEIKGGNHKIVDNTIHCHRNNDKKEFNGIIRASTIKNAVGGKTLVDNNKIFIKTRARAINFTNNTPSELYDLQITNNVINYKGETWDENGITARGEIGKIRISNNQITNGDIFVYHTNSSLIEVTDNLVSGSNSYGIIVNLALEKRGKTAIRIINNTIKNSGLTGIFVRGNKAQNNDADIVGNKITNSNYKRRDAKPFNASIYTDQLNSVKIEKNKMGSDDNKVSQDYLYTTTNTNTLSTANNINIGRKMPILIERVKNSKHDK